MSTILEYALEELEIHADGIYLGMWDVIAVIDVDRDGEWDVTDWRVNAHRNTTKSVNAMVGSSALWTAIKRVLDAQVPLIHDEIEAFVSEEMADYVAEPV
jgi:hypothetical protein